MKDYRVKDEESLFFKYLSKFSKTLNSKKQFNKDNSLDNNKKLYSITSYSIQDNGSNNNKFISLKDSIKITPNKSINKIYIDYIKATNNNNKLKNSIFLKKQNYPKFRPKKLDLDNTNLNSLKKVNLGLFLKPSYSYNHQINRAFSNKFSKIKKKENNSFFTTFNFKNKKVNNFPIINSEKKEKNKYHDNSTYSYVYNDKVHMKFSKNLNKYKYIKPNIYLASFKNFDNNKANIFNLSPEEYNGKNNLFCPLNAKNFYKELNNLRNNFIIKDLMSFNNSNANFFNSISRSVNKKENKKDNGPCFIEKTISYKILDQVKFDIQSPCERAKCQHFINNFNSFVCINKL